MRKSLFKKYLRITSFTILISFFLLGLVMLTFITTNWQDEKQSLLEKNASSVAKLAATGAQEEADGHYTLPGSDMKVFMNFFAENINSDIFIIDLTGKPVLTALGSGSEDPVATEVNIPQEMIKIAVATGMYSNESTMGGLYKKQHYVVGVPIRYTAVDQSTVTIGTVFAACGFQEFSLYRANLIQMFLLAAVASFMISFCIVWLFSYNLVRPLRQMAAAAKSFGDGNFSVHLPVTGQDEIGQLALAFNNMASSLAGGENVRRNFIANVSHELKTPMTTIAGFIDGILDGTIPPEKQQHYLQIVSAEVKRLSRLVRTMLDLSRIDSGELHLRPSRFDLVGTILETLISFEKTIEEKRIEVRGLENIDSLFVDGDPDMIHQVVYNLIENAAKFTNEGGYIEVRVQDFDNRTTVAIKNSGAGIPSDEIGMIFDRFYKTDKSRSKDKTGMGLGLYIVKTIIKLHGGEITVSSIENEYCQFEFWLPKVSAVPALGKEPQKLRDGKEKNADKG